MTSYHLRLFICWLCHVISAQYSRLKELWPWFLAAPCLNSRAVLNSADFRIEWDDLANDIQPRVLVNLLYEDVFRLKSVSKKLKDFIEGNPFQALGSDISFQKATLTTPYFFVKDGGLQCAGFDSSLKKWRRLPPLTYLPNYCKPDPDLFKEYLVCAKGGLVCINFSKSAEEERLIVFNPLTRIWRVLPPLNHRRNPVLMYMLVDPATHSYKIIVAGSSRSGDEHLSRKTEVFDSCTWQWTTTGNFPGPDFALNEFQTGAYQSGNLFCIAFLEAGMGKGILAYNVEKGEWLTNWTCKLPLSTKSTILQLIENCGEVYLFSEQNNDRSIEHCVDRFEWTHCRLINVIRDKKTGGPSLEIYPEYTCVAYSDWQLCIFNTIEHTGVIYDIQHGTQPKVLELPPAKFSGESFYSLNPLSFTIEPSFRTRL